MTKTSAQLGREINEVLSARSATDATAGTVGSQDPAEWPRIFDNLKPGQIVYIAMTAVMGGGRASSGEYYPHKVGRRSKSKSPRWWSEAVSLESLEPAVGSKAPSFAKYKLWKSKNGDISMSHGDMAVMLKGIYAA
jgi:hypothetical protein